MIKLESHRFPIRSLAVTFLFRMCVFLDFSMLDSQKYQKRYLRNERFQPHRSFSPPTRRIFQTTAL